MEIRIGDWVSAKASPVFAERYGANAWSYGAKKHYPESPRTASYMPCDEVRFGESTESKSKPCRLDCAMEELE